MTKIILLLILLAFTVYAVSPDPYCNGDYGYFWDSQKCEQCFSSNCACSSYNTCTKCQTGYNYYTGNSTCLKCGTGIAECCLLENGMAVRATKCIDSYQLFGSVCRNEAYCIGYSDFGQCINCQLGYYIANDNQYPYCNPCSDDIQYCSQCSGPNSCSKCQDGYYLSKDNNVAFKCDACNLNCLCSDSTQLCTSCASQYYFKDTDTSCKRCSTQYDNCATCSSSKCNTCSSGYAYDQTTSKCFVCPENCETCTYDTASSKTSCSTNSCYRGYYLSASNGINSCIKCTDINAIQCKDENTPTQCKALNKYTEPAPHSSSYYLQTVNQKITCVKNDKCCMKMKSSVTTVDEQGQCDTCYPDYVKTAVNSCKKCSTDNVGCLKCNTVASSDTLECTLCQSGIDSLSSNFVLSTDTKKCLPCTDGCKSCSDQNTCTSCISRYFLDSAKCTQCLTYCLQCSSTTTCDKCNPGFRVSSSSGTGVVCESCPKNCLQCDSNRNTCTLCGISYYLQLGTCYPKDPYCAVVNPNGSCKVCHYKQRLVNGKCYACGSLESGYINCPQQCTTQKYVRDGDILTSTLNNSVNNSLRLEIQTIFLLFLSAILLALY